MAKQAAAAAAAAAAEAEATTGGDTTLKTSSTATTSTTSLFQSTLSSNATTTTMTNLTTQSSASLKLARLQQAKQYPPLSASSKFASTNCLLSIQQRMTSTASNTFIEEENADLVEVTTVSSGKENGTAYVAQAAAAKINEMIRTSGGGVQKMTSCEIGYAEFSVCFSYILVFNS